MRLGTPAISKATCLGKMGQRRSKNASIRSSGGFADGRRSVALFFADGTWNVPATFVLADGTWNVPAAFVFADGTRSVPATLEPDG